MNMKNKIIFLLMPVASMALTSCGQVMEYEKHLDDYVSYMEYHDDFNILQLTDIHWSYESSTLRSKKYLEKTIAEADRHIKELQGNDAKIDLVELTGDQFMLANTYHIDTFLKFFEQQAEKYDFYYAVIWGNHDRQGLYNANWLAKRFKESKHCIYKELNDNLYGRSNFVINLTLDGTKDSGAVWQVFNLDSGASFSETSLSPFRDYDYIRKDQTDWYVKEHEKVGETVPTLAYYHIPQDENETAWKEVKENPEAYKNKFFKLEGFADNGNEKYASDFIDVAREHGLKGAFMGHAHNVDWTVEVDGVVIGLGVKTGTELYFAHIDTQSTDVDMQAGLKSVGITENFDLIGASLVTIKNGLEFDLEHLYLNERASGDFTSWVKW
jgi:predicted MPP superfamily phosphohydrolase